MIFQISNDFSNQYCITVILPSFIMIFISSPTGTQRLSTHMWQLILKMECPIHYVSRQCFHSARLIWTIKEMGIQKGIGIWIEWGSILRRTIFMTWKTVGEKEGFLYWKTAVEGLKVHTNKICWIKWLLFKCFYKLIVMT
jgi:hypothetical protein